MTKHLIGTSEAADLLGVDRSVINRRVSAGILAPVSKMPGRTGAYVFDRAEIEKLAAAR